MSQMLNIMHGTVTIDTNGIHSPCPPDIYTWLSSRQWWQRDEKFAHANYPQGMYWHEAVAIEFVNFMRIGHD